MRYGVFGDIHSSIDALEAVLGELRRQNVQGWICTGDVVGYGPDPAECIRRVREIDPVIVAGNHDWAVAGQLGLEYFNTQAQAAILWTRRVLDREEIQWLGSLELVQQLGEDITVAHGTVHEPQHFDYMQTAYDAYLSFEALRTPTGFVGHSHVPVTFLDGVPITYSIEQRLELGSQRAIINPGSVGQPRDEDPRASCAVYDSASRTLEIRRVSYDVQGTIGRILRAGLPPLLGERLRVGR